MKPTPPDDRGSPLPYRNPADDRPAARAAASVAVGSGLLAVAVVGAVGFVVFAESFDLHPPPGGPRHRWPQVIGFGATAAAAGAGVVYLWGDRRKRSAAVGFLLGLLVACLVEGTCFYNP